MTAQTILPANTLSSGYDVANSVRMNKGSSDSLSKSLSAGSQRKATYSFWIKFSDVAASETSIYALALWTDANNNFLVRFQETGNLDLEILTGGSYAGRKVSNRKFRDFSAWYNFVIIVDTTDGTAADRLKIFVNGVRETSFSASTDPSSNADLKMNVNNQTLYIGQTNGGAYMDAYFAEVVWLDGTAAAATDFGEFDEDSGIWKPIDVSGLTAGTNGFYLDFEASGNLGNDVFGGTDLTENNLTAVDQSTDTCTNNFATLNPLSTGNKQAQRHVALSEGNLFAVGNSSSNNGNAYTTMAVNTGKWYCEIKATDVRGTGYPYIGVCNETCHNKGGQAGLDSSAGVDGVAYSPDGRKNINGTSSSYGNSFTDNDIIGIALDLDNGAVYFSKNGTFQASGDPTSGSSKTNAVHTFTVGDFYFFAIAVFEAASDVSCNFGSPAFAISSSNTDGDGYGNFEYAVPSGYFALNTKNLAEYG